MQFPTHQASILPVAPTPFLDDGALDQASMRNVLDCLIDQGADAICVLANYSEQFVLSDAERSLLARLSLEHVAGRVPVIVTVSHFSTAVARARAQEAERLGASMVMMMPPYHGATLRAAEGDIFDHFAQVAAAITIPIMVQDAPLSGVHLPVPLLARMAREIGNVSHFKIETSFAADKLAALIAAGGDHVVGPYDGEEAVTLLADLDAGATATMTSGLLPEHVRPIVVAHKAGQADEAVRLWTRALPLINHENRQCGLRACKAVYAAGGVIRSDHVRHPQAPLPERTRARLLQLAADLDLIALRWGQ